MATASKILHVLRSPRAEGTVRLALDLMRTAECEHELLVLEAEPSDLADELRRAARWVRIESALPGGARKFPWMILKIWKACRARRPDIVICWPNGFGAFVLFGAASAGVRRLISHAGNPPTPTWLRPGPHPPHNRDGLGPGRSHDLLLPLCRRPIRPNRRRFRPHLAGGLQLRAAGLIRAVAEAARAQRTDRNPRLIMVATLEPHTRITRPCSKRCPRSCGRFRTPNSGWSETARFEAVFGA